MKKPRQNKINIVVSCRLGAQIPTNITAATKFRRKHCAKHEYQPRISAAFQAPRKQSPLNMEWNACDSHNNNENKHLWDKKKTVSSRFACPETKQCWKIYVMFYVYWCSYDDADAGGPASGSIIIGIAIDIRQSTLFVGRHCEIWKQLLCSNAFVIVIRIWVSLNVLTRSPETRVLFSQTPIYTIYWVFNLHCLHYGPTNLRSMPERIVKHVC